MKENTPFSDVFDFTISKLTDYSFFELTEDELTQEFTKKMRISLAKCITFKDIKADYDMEEFSRELSDLEIDIISNWMIVEYLNPKINSIEILKPRMASKDYQTFSQANHLKELSALRKEASSTAHYWMNRYPLIIASQNRVK